MMKSWSSGAKGHVRVRGKFQDGSRAEIPAVMSVEFGYPINIYLQMSDVCFLRRESINATLLIVATEMLQSSRGNGRTRTQQPHTKVQQANWFDRPG
jgi:hypothetical protein